MLSRRNTRFGAIVVLVLFSLMLLPVLLAPAVDWIFAHKGQLITSLVVFILAVVAWVTRMKHLPCPRCTVGTLSRPYIHTDMQGMSYELSHCRVCGFVRRIPLR